MTNYISYMFIIIIIIINVVVIIIMTSQMLPCLIIYDIIAIISGNYLY